MALFLPIVAIVAAAAAVVLFFTCVKYIPNSKAGVVERLWGGAAARPGLISLDDGPGFLPGVLRGGFHFFAPFQYKVHIVPLVTIPQGKIGYVFARDGGTLPATQALASNNGADDFENVEAFLRKGGQKGPQRKILREGTYAINLAQFVVLTEDALYHLPIEASDANLFRRMAALVAERRGFTPVVISGAEDAIGIVTVHDGPSLREGQIIAPAVGDDPKSPSTYHNNYQDADRFLAAGGMRGRQLSVLVEGTYYINRLFATVELVPKTVIEVGHVGVVVSYTGNTGDDLSGQEYGHGELVEAGQRGVWNKPLLPGKYAFNTYAGRVVLVPTTNIILKWIKNDTGTHRFDENLAEVSLITKDAFEPWLPLSVVIHIDYRKAPLVIQRFGDIRRLVEQTLDPMVAAYFKNVAQTRTLIQLIQERSNIQAQACDEMKIKFGHYNLELEEVLIGTPSSPVGDNRIDEILLQLRSRQIAEERIETYARQERAAAKERELREAEARAKRQQQLTESEVAIQIQSNEGKAEYQRSLQKAAQIRALAEAEAERAARIGVAEAIAIDEQVRAYGGPQYQVMQAVMTRFSEAIEKAGVDVVPKVMVGGQQGTSGVFESLLSMMLSEKLGINTASLAAPRARSDEAEQLRSAIQASVAKPTPPPLPTARPAK